MSEEAYINFNTKTIVLGKTDLSNAFRVLPLKIRYLSWLVLKAEDLKDGKTKYFVDKCLPFGASISCSHYQRFSNSLKFIITVKTGHKTITNYLDDFLFIAILKSTCDSVMHKFLEMCKDLGILVALEKTEWSSTQIVFLGILLDGEHLILAVPIEKQEKALKLLRDIEDKKSVTIEQIQVLTGYLNFITKAIFAGRTFTRRMYSKGSVYQKKKDRSIQKLKQHHHIKLDPEFKFDCAIWKTFLENHTKVALCRPMIDLDKNQFTAKQLAFSSDASAAESLGFGAMFNKHWIFGQWEPGYIKQFKPNIEYLELYAVVAAILTWSKELKNIRMILYCDNSAVVTMINNLTSGCKNCMYLLRLLTLDNLIHSHRVFAKHLKLEENYLSDALSRLKIDKFCKLIPAGTDKYPTRVSEQVWPASKIWQKF